MQCYGLDGSAMKIGKGCKHTHIVIFRPLRRILFSLLILCALPLQTGAGQNQSEADAIQQVIKIFYDTWEKGELDKHYGTRFFGSDSDRQKAISSAASSWKRVAIQITEVHDMKVALSPTGKEAAAGFAVAWNVRLAESDKVFSRQDKKIALLVYQDGWKIRKILPQSESGVIPQGMSEEDIKELQYDQEIAALLHKKQEIAPPAAILQTLPEVPPSSAAALPIMPVVEAIPQAEQVETDDKVVPGKILALITLEKASVKQPQGMREIFSLDAPEVYVWFKYMGYSAGTILSGVWRDVGRGMSLGEYPVIIMSSEGSAGFSIRRPMDGWTKSRYQVEIKAGGEVIKTVGFTIDE